ncbi:Oleate hydroxylase FAH12 [Fusarium oxysporum f. sp. albedinis]|nr:Oleate hydroxylase FAH12 [Fusarium oxysporum f. sp. albedinis]
MLCYVIGIGIYLHASYKNAISHKGLVIRDAKLVFPSESNFCNRISRPHSIQHIISTNGASYRAYYPSAGWPGKAGISQPLLEPDTRRAEISLACQRPSSGREHIRERKKR